MNYILGFLGRMLPYMAIAAPIYTAVRSLLLRRRGKKREKVNWYHETGLFLFVIFIAGLASVTVIPDLQLTSDGPRFLLDGSHETRLIPLRFICYTYRDIVVNHSCYSLLINLLGNVVMFMPFGFFPPLLWKVSGKTAVASGFFTSLAVEVSQLFLPRWTDIDDIILNTLGAALGFVLFRLLRRRFPAFTDRFYQLSVFIFSIFKFMPL